MPPYMELNRLHPDFVVRQNLGYAFFDFMDELFSDKMVFRMTWITSVGSHVVEN